jgi:hypothetical protein
VGACDHAVRLAVVDEELEERIRRERLRTEDAGPLPVPDASSSNGVMDA